MRQHADDFPHRGLVYLTRRKRRMGEDKMLEYTPTRAEAWSLLNRYNENDSLLRHALAVEAVMRHFAGIHAPAEVEQWGVIGLVHDLDYGQFPDLHCKKVRELLEAEKWPEAWIRAVESHGWELCVPVKPESLPEKILYTIDELTGLITATALLRPSKSVLDLETKSVKKKWKQASFASGVNREVIEKGAEMLGWPLDGIITETILGMRDVAEAIGLKGTPEAI
jgi:predicted hydrolase (HD superfamily)